MSIVFPLEGLNQFTLAEAKQQCMQFGFGMQTSTMKVVNLLKERRMTFLKEVDKLHCRYAC